MVPVQSVKRALDLLDVLFFEDVPREGIGLFELARRVGLRPNTAHNLLKSMAACGYVAQNAESKYMAGPKFDEICKTKSLVSSEVLDVIIREFKHLVSQLGESFLFATLIGGRRVPLVEIDSDEVIQVDLSAVEQRSIYDMGTGRILVAYADEYALSQIKLVSGLPGEVWDNIDTDEALDAARSDVREVGYLLFSGKRPGLATFSCPVMDASGRLLGAIGCYAPLFRCPPDKQKKILKEMLSTADRMGRLR